MRTAENIRRIRQKRGLSYAELSRRLAGIGHPIPDTSLLKIEKGDRRVDVDDVVALAVALSTTPNRLILPPGEPEHSAERHQLTPAIAGTPPHLWAWATGELPLGRHPSTARTDLQARAEESAFSRENMPQRWLPSPPIAQDNGEQVAAATMIIMFVGEYFRAGADTEDIRSVIESALMGVLISADPTQRPRVEKSEDGGLTVTIGRPATEEPE